MQHVLKPYVTAGVAIVGAGLVAVNPANVAHHGGAIAREVTLTADGFGLPDLLGPYIAAYNTAAGNLSAMLNSYYVAPDIGFQQALSNLSGYVQQILDDPSTIPAMTNAIQTDLKNAWSSLTLMNADQDTINDVIRHTMDSSYLLGNLAGGHELIFGQIPGFLPADQADALTPIINFLGSPMSAILMGSIGPWIAPSVALANSLQDLSADLQGGDGSAAFHDLLNIPANMLNASLNGATLNLDSLLPVINDAGLFPGGMEMTHLDIAFGGWLSAGGHVTAGPMHVMDGNTEIAQVPASGGSIFNSIGLGLNGVPVIGSLDLQSDPVGPIGAWLGLSQVLGAELGWGSWNGKDPQFNVPVLNPGAEIVVPTIPEDFFDDGGMTGDLGLDGLLQDLLGAFNV